MQGTARSIVRHGFVVLLLALLLGFGVAKGGAPARAWMGAHITALIVGALIVLVGLVWDQLSLGARGRAVLRWAAVLDGYLSVVAGAFAALAGIPGPATGGGAQPSGTAGMVFLGGFIPVLTLLPFLFVGLTLYGLRGERTS